MKFNKINTARPSDRLLSDDIIAEAYPRRQFSYANYTTDPRPNVLILGRMRHPSTGNNLTYGVNLNYLSKSQIASLRKMLPNIFNEKNLKARYWKLRDTLPDVAKYYRSYDNDYIHKVEVGDLDDFMSQMPKSTDKVDATDKQAAKTTIAAKDAEDSLEPSIKLSDPEVDDDPVDHDRQAWEIDRQLYNPDTKKKNVPEKDEYDIDAEIEKDDRYKMQRRKAKDLKRRAELERFTKQLQQADQEETTSNFDNDLEDVEELATAAESYYYSPNIGFVWDSPHNYVKYHKPNDFIAERKEIGSILKSSVGEKVLAAYNILSKELIVDLGSDHNLMLHEANWNNSLTILFEPVGNEVVIQYEHCLSEDLENAVHTFQNSIVPMLMAEATP